MARKRKKPVDGIGKNLPVTTFGNVRSERAAAFVKGASGGTRVGSRVAGSRIVPTGVNTSTVTVNGKPITPVGASVIPDASRPTASTNYLTQEEIERNKKLLEYPPESTKEPDKSWFDTLLDTTDTWKPVLDANGKHTGTEEFQGVSGNPLSWVGAAWDSGLRALQWGTDRLTQASVAAMSAAPGGTRTWTWDEAGNVSFGQQMLADAAATQGRITRGEGTAGDSLGRVLGGLASVGAAIAANNDPNTVLQRRNFDLQDQQMREEAFSQGWERAFSGAADFGFAFADPTLFLGWGGKLARLRYIDRVISDEKSLNRAVEEINYGKHVFDVNKPLLDSGELSVESLRVSGAARFLYETTRKGENGEKLIPLDQIMNHRVIKRASNRDALGAALYAADDYDEAALIMRHAWGDSTAAKELLQRRPDVLVEIIDGEREIVSMMIAANPAKQGKLVEQYQLKMDQYDAELDWMKKNIGDDPNLADKIEFVRTKKNEVAEKWLAAKNGKQPVLGASSKPTPDEIAAVKARVDFLKSRDKNLTRALDEARIGGPSGLYGSMRGSTAGFASSTRLGRQVESSRWRRAEAQYQSEMIRGTHFWQADTFFGTSKTRRALRVWRYLGQETPSGVVHLAGIGAQESTREVRAMLNSVRIYGGKGKQVGVNADGTPKFVGGVARKEDLLTRYQNAVLEGGVSGRNDMAAVLRDIEKTIESDLVEWYGFNSETMAQIMNKVNSTRQKLKDDILSRGFWVDEDGTENAIPFLESQLQGSDITADWRKIETAVRDYMKESRGGARGAARAAYDTGEKWTVSTYETFQDLWRPAVLLRLGYTQRNVSEGLFRSMAFQFSLAPLAQAAKQGGLSVGNVARVARVGRTGARGATEKAMVAARKGEEGPRQFRKWMENQKAQHVQNMQNNRDVIAMARTSLAEESEAWRLAEMGRLQFRLDDLAQKNADLTASIPTGTSKGDIALAKRINASIASNKAWASELQNRMLELKKVRGGEGDLTPEMAVIEDNLRYFEDVIEPSLRAQGQVLDDPLSAAILFRERTLARRRVYSGSADFSTPKDVQSTFLSMMEGGAFNPSDPYAAIALANLSADGTMKQAAALRMTTAQTVFQSKVTRHYKAIDYDKNPEEYFDGLATMLNQFSQSEVGKIVIKGLAEGKMTDDDIAGRIASFIRTTPEGREIGMFVTSSSQAARKAKWVSQPEATRAAEKAAMAAAAPLRKAADDAGLRAQRAAQEVADAQARLAVAQQKNPRLKALYDSNGKRIADPVKYVQRADDAARKAEDAWQRAYDADLKQRLEPIQGRFEAPVLSMEDALSYGMTMVKRYRELTADSPQLQQYLAANSLDVGGRSGKRAGDVLKEFIGPGATRPDGSAYVLRPVIGNMVEESGHPSLMDQARRASNFGFKWLGTIPEDNFVRAPFYGRRYEKVYRELERSMLAQNPQGLTVKQVNMLRDAAHRRSLKDTKDWLYTIDRRTMLGQYGEAIFPFISATQNSVTTVGRLIWNDPRVLWGMSMIWQAPQRAGIENEQGEIVIPVAWLPEAVKNVLPLDSMENIIIRKSGLNVVLPENGFGMIPTPGPVAVVPISTMMQHGFLGLDAIAPQPLVAVLGQEQADAAWETLKSYVYGSEDDITGMSSQPLSWDKAMPPWIQKVIQVWQGEGGSSAYTTWYNRIYQTEMLKWGAGLRDEIPSPDEVAGQARAFFALRIAGNLLAFTPPGYESTMQPIIDSVQKIYDTVPDRDKASQIVYEQFGPMVQQLGKLTTTASVAGVGATPDGLRFAEANDQLISTIAPVLEDNGTLDVIGFLAPSSDAEYDPSISARQQVMDIAGTDRKWREIRDPREAWIESQKSAGWAQYLKNMDLLNALMAQRGLKSLQAKGAEDLLEQKNEMVENMRQDPRYQAWYADYKNFSSTRTTDTVAVMEAALSSKSFRENNMDSPIWGPGGYAEQYLNFREEILAAARATGKSLAARENQPLLEQWLAFRGDLAAQSPEWAAKQERYLDGDDNPETTQVISVTLEDTYTPEEGVSPNAPDYMQPGMEEGMMYG